MTGPFTRFRRRSAGWLVLCGLSLATFLVLSKAFNQFCYLVGKYLF